MGLVIGGWRAGSLLEAARWVDGHQRLQERLSTALEVARSEENGAWRELIISDAAEHAKQVDEKRLVTFSLTRAARWALPILALGVGLGFVPEYRSKDYLRQTVDRENIKQVGRQLSELTRRSLEKRPPALDPTQKAMEAVEQTGQHLTKASLTRADALKELASVTEKLKAELSSIGKDPSLRRMEQAARANSGSAASASSAPALQQQMEALKKQLGTPTGNPDQIDKFKETLEKLKEQATAQAQSADGQSDEQRQAMSAALSALSRQMQEAGLQMPMLDQAIEALANDQTDLFLKDLNTAVADLQKTRDMAKALQQLQQQMEKLGKDLGEQLSKGQPEAAQMTLQKMVEQLRSENMNAEQMQKLMSEVNKAIEPAGNYGEVAKHLQKAKDSMKAGSKEGAAESLAAAAKELEGLMQQMGDAESLMAELEMLKEASMCIANGSMWGKGSRPGFGKRSGQPGSGVGTWGDDSQSWDGQISDGWDNSGIERPDMDPRGMTDRGAGGLSEALQPTKVKGQFSPGNQMPSVTLKGVSIRGQSSVEYQESAAAAQSEAESALSQEKVPRAYQGAVRDYFDDQKK